ncbi:MAG: helix-turn-helix domain-containing protein [Hyphomicrobiales bacterium]
MSWKSTGWAQDVVTGSTVTKCILYAVANYADEDGVCWPSQDRLATDTECSLDTVQRHLKKLEENGTIIRQRRANKDRKRQTDLIILCMASNRLFWSDVSEIKLHRNERPNIEGEEMPENEESNTAGERPNNGQSYTAGERLTNESYTAERPKVTPQVCGLHIEAEPSLEPSLSVSERVKAATDPINEKKFTVEQKEFRSKISEYRQKQKNDAGSLMGKAMTLVDDYLTKTNITERAERLGMLDELAYVAHSALFSHAMHGKPFDVGGIDKHICINGFEKKLVKAEILFGL